MPSTAVNQVEIGMTADNLIVVFLRIGRAIEISGKDFDVGHGRFRTVFYCVCRDKR